MSDPAYYQSLGLHTLRLHGVLSNGACACGSPTCRPTSAGKHPIRNAWQTTPPDSNFAPGENVGIRCGVQPSGLGLIAMDVDDVAQFSALEARLGSLPTTMRTDSGRGFHLLFHVPPDFLPLLRNFVHREGCDLRAERGQVVAGPSLHYSGKRYVTSRDPIAFLPPTWFAWLTSNCEARKPDAPAEACPLPEDDRWLSWGRMFCSQTPAEYPSGGSCWKLALRLRKGLCLPYASALTLMREWNASAGNPRPEAKLARAVEQAACRGEQPWGFARPLREDLNAADGPWELAAPQPAHAQPSLGQLATAPQPEPPEFSPRVRRVEALTSVDLQALGARRGAKPVLRELAAGSAFTSVLEFSRALQVLAGAMPDGVEWSAHSVAGLLQRCWCGDPNGFNVQEAWGNVLQSLRECDLSILGVQKVFWSHAQWQGCLAFDEMAQRSVWRKAPPVTRAIGEHVTDADCIAVRSWFQQQFGDDPGKDRTWDAINGFAQNYATFNPLQDWLNGLQWDGTLRLDTWLVRALGAAATPFAQIAGSKWMISAIARAMQPGCKADHVLVLQGGREGEGKSSTFEMLAKRDEWFVSVGSDLGSKESKELLRGKWIICLDELASLRRSEKNAVKSFVTLRSDDYRKAYGRDAEQYKRRGVFGGTLNEQEFLDEDPERRWLPIAVRALDRDWLAGNVDQLWAEARVRFERGEDWWQIPADLRAEAQADFKFVDPIKELILQWVARSPEGPKPFLLTDLCAGIGQEYDVGSTRRLASALRRMGFERRSIWNHSRQHSEWRWLKP